MQGNEDEGMLVLRSDAALAVEGELRKTSTPDQWCTLEAMRAGLLRIEEAGVTAHEILASVPPERRRLAAQQLLPIPVRSWPMLQIVSQFLTCSAGISCPFKHLSVYFKSPASSVYIHILQGRLF